MKITVQNVTDVCNIHIHTQFIPGYGTYEQAFKNLLYHFFNIRRLRVAKNKQSSFETIDSS